MLWISDKKDDSKTDRTISQSTNRSEVDRPPATFSLKEKYEYFKPCVQVQWEDEGTKSMAKELYIRGKFLVHCVAMSENFVNTH